MPPDELVDELEELVEELDVEVVPDELVELDVPASDDPLTMVLSPHAAATRPTINPEAIPILRMAVTLFLVRAR